MAQPRRRRAGLPRRGALRPPLQVGDGEQAADQILGDGAIKSSIQQLECEHDL